MRKGFFGNELLVQCFDFVRAVLVFLLPCFASMAERTLSLAPLPSFSRSCLLLSSRWPVRVFLLFCACSPAGLAAGRPAAACIALSRSLFFFLARPGPVTTSWSSVFFFFLFFLSFSLCRLSVVVGSSLPPGPNIQALMAVCHCHCHCHCAVACVCGCVCVCVRVRVCVRVCLFLLLRAVAFACRCVGVRVGGARSLL